MEASKSSIQSTVSRINTSDEKWRHSTLEGILSYEWESAKSKPHARIISRKAPKLEAVKTGEMENLFGLSRIGRENNPRAILTGRIPDPLEPKPDGRPAAYSGQPLTGKYKPHPLIVSRQRVREVGSGSGIMQNNFGMTRFGKANPPRPVIISRHFPKDKAEPGPGAYDAHVPFDHKVGIQIKGRLKAWEHGSPQPGANAYYLPSTFGDGPAFSFAGRYEDDIHTGSPGPIYNTRVPLQKKKGKSLTFKPFPVKQQKEFPGPNEYENLPGSQKIKSTLPRAPVVRFAGKPYVYEEDFGVGTQVVENGPGPANFNLSKYHGTSVGKPNALILSRPKTNYTGSGVAKFENLFGKTRFGPANPPRAVIVCRHPKIDKSLPGPGAYNPGKTTDTRVGITMKSRWTTKQEDTGPGPADYLPYSIRKGPAKVPKFRGELGILEKVPKLDADTSCKQILQAYVKAKTECEPCDFFPKYLQCQFPGSSMFDEAIIPKLEEYLLTKRQ